MTPGVDRAGQDASSFIEGKSLEDSYSKLITNFLISKAFYHLGELKPPLKSLDASLQACQSLSTEGQNKEKRSVKSTVSSDPQLKFSLRLHFSDPVFRSYSELQGGAAEEQGRGEETAELQAISYNLCLQSLTDFSTIGKL